MTDDIKNSRHPLIVFTPPSSDSQHKRGMCYFKNGKKDQMGHPQTPLDLGSSDEASDENDTISGRHDMSEGLKSKSEIRDGDPRISSEYESTDNESEKHMPSKQTTVSPKRPKNLGLKSTGKRRLRSAMNHDRSGSGDREANLKRLRPRRVTFTTVEQLSSDTETLRQGDQGSLPSHAGQDCYRMHEGSHQSHQTIDEGWNPYCLQMPEPSHTW